MQSSFMFLITSELQHPVQQEYSNLHLLPHSTVPYSPAFSHRPLGSPAYCDLHFLNISIFLPECTSNQFSTKKLQLRIGNNYILQHLHTNCYMLSRLVCLAHTKTQQYIGHKHKTKLLCIYKHM